MTEAVVDELEAVEIEEQDGALELRTLLDPVQNRGEPVHEIGSVAQFGQVVVECLVEEVRFHALAAFDLLLESRVLSLRDARPHGNVLDPLAIGDVALHRDPVREPALLVGDRDDAEFHPERGSHPCGD